MNNSKRKTTPQKTGVFIFSLDTELGTGYFDLDQKRHEKFSRDGSRERAAVNQILDMLEKRNLVGTWAVVGHLFYEKCEKCEICPLKSWQGKYSSYDEAYGSAHPLWYGYDVIQNIISRKPRQEIGFHGYSHKIFNESLMTEEEAEIEIKEWIRVAKRLDIDAKSIVFPRDLPGYLDLFQKYGFTCFRKEIKKSLWLRNRYFGKYLKTIDHLLGITNVPIHGHFLFKESLIELPESEHLFGFNRKLELFLDKIGLEQLRIRRIIRAVRRAGIEGKILHLWAHPWEFRTEKDLQKLERILDAVHTEVQNGRMVSIGMAELAENLSKI